MKDLHNNIEVVSLLDPVVVAATATIDDIDLAGWESAELVIALGTDAGTGLSATDYWTFTLYDSADGTTYAAVETADMLGVTVSSGVILTVDATTEDNVVHHFGYVGGKRYLRLVYTETTTGSNSTPMAILLIKSHAQDSPTI